jgi:Fe-S cluster assembly scaffold protein SufB
MASRGIGGAEARAMALHAFFEPVARRLPLEFAVELTRLLDVELGDVILD